MTIGDKVVCIEERPVTGSDPSQWTIIGGLPKKGMVYVVSAVNFYTIKSVSSIGLELIGITAFNTFFPEIRGFNSKRFRLLSELKEKAKEHHDFRQLKGNL